MYVYDSLEPLVKGVGAAEHVWQQEVEQSPQLVQVVLQSRHIRGKEREKTSLEGIILGTADGPRAAS